jgi:hypothetical protein
MNDAHVALTKCFFCGGPGDIVLATRYRHDHTPVVNVKERCHNKVINMEPCNSCKEYMRIGIILISIRDGEGEKIQEEMKLHPEGMPNPYRTGCFTVMREEAAKRMFTEDSTMFRFRWTFIEDALWDKIGLPKSNADHTHPNEAKGPIGECQVCKTRRQLDTAWSRNRNGDTINARCLKCDPNDEDFKLIPHTLMLYETRVNAGEPG